MQLLHPPSSDSNKSDPNPPKASQSIIIGSSRVLSLLGKSVVSGDEGGDDELNKASDKDAEVKVEVKE